MVSVDVSLPATVLTPGDLQRMRRELESVDNFLLQASLRQGGKATQLPPTSNSLEELAASYGLNMLKKTDREQLKKNLTALISKAPVLHFSFASEPSNAFLGKLVAWLRENIHPQVVVRVGLQPSVVAGCMVRGNNKQFDMTLRKSFDDQYTMLLEAIRAKTAEETAETAEKPAGPVQQEPQLVKSKPMASTKKIEVEAKS